MRIIAGKHRSRRLVTPENDAIRPTADKVRQALFNMLNARGLVVDAVVLDAFCGTGALGLEALSQGAASAILFDKDKASISVTRSNIALLKEDAQTLVFHQDVTNAKECPKDVQPANFVFLDPPYHKNLVTPALKSLIDKGWVESGAYIVIEAQKNEIINCPQIKIESEKTYGDTKVILGVLNSVASVHSVVKKYHK